MENKSNFVLPGLSLPSQPSTCVLTGSSRPTRPRATSPITAAEVKGLVPEPWLPLTTEGIGRNVTGGLGGPLFPLAQYKNTSAVTAAQAEGAGCGRFVRVGEAPKHKDWDGARVLTKRNVSPVLVLCLVVSPGRVYVPAWWTAASVEWD